MDGAKMGDPQEKPHGHQEPDFGFSHVWLEQGLNPKQWDIANPNILEWQWLNNHSACIHC